MFNVMKKISTLFNYLKHLVNVLNREIRHANRMSINLNNFEKLIEAPNFLLSLK